MTGTIPRWVEVMQALLTPTIAVAGIGIGVLNHLLARRRRKDELFDRRYEFYQRVREMWMSTGVGANNDEDPEVHAEDLVPMAEEARLLFGEDVAQHIMSLAGPGHQGHPFFPDGTFTEPFEKYLRL